jgi:hypothetical protein
MKSKKIKKILKKLIEKERSINLSPKSKHEQSNKYWSIDVENSRKFKDLLMNVIEYDNMSIHIEDESINISFNIKDIKSGVNKQSLNDDDYIEFNIRKDIGFTLSRGYNTRASYKDNGFYYDILPLIEKKVKNLNDFKFKDVYEHIMLKSGLIRDSNLDNILN